MRLPFIRRLSASTPTIFISYRRDDSSGYAGRLHDSLRARWGDEHVRMDVDDIPLGSDYAEVAREMVAASDILLVLIGPRWLDERNRGRLDDPGDLLRLEVETALEKKVRVIPVLLNGAPMPGPGVLPPSLVPLLKRNAFELSERRWSYDVQDLITTIERLPEHSQPQGGSTSPGDSWRSIRQRPWILVALALMLAGAVAGTPHLLRRLQTTNDVAVADPDSVVLPKVISEISAEEATNWPRRIDRRRFFEIYVDAFPDSVLTERQRWGIDTLLSLIEADTSMRDLRWSAYMLATIKHETADRWWPIEEYAKGRGFKHGLPVKVVDAQGDTFSNVYYGRGYVQLSLVQNYQNMGRVLNNRLLYEPELALRPDVAYQVTSYAMRNGAFTGVNLSRFLNSDFWDYVSARRMVNGMDQAVRIAGYAVKLERALRVGTAQPGAPLFFVIPKSLDVCSAPRALHSTFATLPQGTLVLAMENRADWKKVTASGITGWVLTDSLRPAIPEPQ